jgi:hypothetical protein
MTDRDEILQHHLDVILGKMFEMVNLDWSNPEVKAEYKVFEKDSQWYWKNEWSMKQENEFIEWLTQYLMGNSGARRAIMGYPHKSKKHCEGAARWFDMQYGWKTIMEERDGES